MLVKMQSNKQFFSSIISENGLFSIRKMKTNKNFVKSRTCCPSEIEDFGDKKARTVGRQPQDGSGMPIASCNKISISSCECIYCLNLLCVNNKRFLIMLHIVMHCLWPICFHPFLILSLRKINLSLTLSKVCF